MKISMIYAFLGYQVEALLVTIKELKGDVTSHTIQGDLSVALIV